MNKNDIIAQISQDKNLIKDLKNIYQGKHQEDFLAEMWLILLEKSDELIESLHSRGQLKWFILRIALNQAHSVTSPFYTKYRKNNSTISVDELNQDNNEYGNEWLAEENIDENDDEYNKLIFINKSLKQLNWYDNEIFTLYITSDKSFTTLEKEIKISRNSLFNTVKKVRTKIKKLYFMEQIKKSRYD